MFFSCRESPPIHRDGCAGDIVRFDEKDDGLGRVLGRAEALKKRCARTNPSGAGGRALRRQEGSGQDGVDLDAGRQSFREGLGEAQKPGLGDAIGDAVGPRLQGREIRDVDDLKAKDTK